ncbi:alpha/beta fold hydrolase [Demequina sp. NBRC 110057]|uniref:alpha/beta fold hydrolase n=1 Tax=Demequina sp. NBRC 110057 TaxID=1570346 RepID=UPI0009FEA0BB|nr:alpha/beta hydrolase [Demequina sp. NBRC 110057]
MSPSFSPARRLIVVALALIATLVAASQAATASPSPSTAAAPRPAIPSAALPAAVAETASSRGHAKPKPTIVLVHGAFADSSGWALVTPALEAAGYPVIAFSNPLRGPQHDAAYLRAFLDTLEGPIVLVGHSYGGVVITNAATGDDDVTDLVYIAAYAPAEGESVQAMNALGGGHSDVTNHLVVRPFPGASEGDADAYIDPAYFRQLFAQDLPRSVAATMAGSQRPGALAALVAPSGEPAWETIPSWYMVAKNDRIIPPEAERVMADRADATTVEVSSSHVPMLSKPAQVVALILRAAR